MRKPLLFLITSVCLSIVLASCEKENKSAASYKAAHNLELAVSEDLLNLADLVLTYTDENNAVVKTIKIEKTTFKNSINYTSFPVTAGFKLTLTAKEGASAEKYNLSISGESSVSAVMNGENKVVSGSTDGLEISLTGTVASNLPTALQRIQKLLDAFSSTYTITVKDGAVVYSNS